MKKVIFKILGGELVFRRDGLDKERFEKVASYVENLIKKMFEKEFTPPTREEIRNELLK